MGWRFRENNWVAGSRRERESEGSIRVQASEENRPLESAGMRENSPAGLRSFRYLGNKLVKKSHSVNRLVQTGSIPAQQYQENNWAPQSLRPSHQQYPHQPDYTRLHCGKKVSWCRGNSLAPRVSRPPLR